MSTPLRPVSADAFTQIQRQIGQKFSLIRRFTDPAEVGIDPVHKEKVAGLLSNLDEIIRVGASTKAAEKSKLLRDTAIQLMHARLNKEESSIVAGDPGVVGTFMRAVMRMSSTEALNQLVESLCKDFETYSPFFQAAMILADNLSKADLLEVLNTLEPESITEEKLSILKARQERLRFETSERAFYQSSLHKEEILEFLMEPMTKPLARLLGHLITQSNYAMSSNLIINRHIAEELLIKPDRLRFLLKKIRHIEPDAVPAFLFICTKSPEAFFNNCAKLMKQPLRGYEIDYLAANAASLILARNRKDMDADFALNHYGFADTPPAVSGSELSKKILTEAQAVIRSSTIFHQGFGALTYAVRSYAATPLLVKAFNTVCQNPDEDIARIHSSDFNAFPGSGTYIKNINPRKLFNIPETYNSQRFSISELPERVKAAWTPYSKALAALEDSQFYLMRGAMIVTQPSNQNLILPGDDGELFHYSLIVFNDHFHNTGTNIAFLVPTEILTPKLNACLVGHGNKKTPTSDINSTSLDIDSLAEMAAAIGAPLINIASSSCYFGGLCNAYPAGSSPYHEWEHPLNDPRDGLTDTESHVHKYFFFPHDGSSTSPEAEVMRKLIEAHDKVYSVADTLLGQLKLLPIILALWNKGTIRTPEEGEIPRELERDEDPMNLGMTDEAYRTWKHCKHIHQHLKSSGQTDRNEFPLLAVTPLNWSKQAKIRTWIDTYDLTVVKKPADSPAVTTDLTKLQAEAQEAYFIKHLFIPAGNPNLDLRFIHRNTISKENKE